MLVSIVLPVRNQADHIERVVAEYSAALEGIEHQLILVVNGSTDATLAACRSARADAGDGTVDVIESMPGWGAAVLAGLGAARGDVLCYANSARTAAPDLRLAVSLSCVDSSGSLLVKATRRYRKSLIRQAASLVYNLEARTLLDIGTWDVNGTPKAFSRALFRRLRLTEAGDLLDLEVMAECRRLRVTVVGFDTDLTERAGGRSTTTPLSAIRIYLQCFRFARRIRRPPAKPRAAEWRGQVSDDTKP
ncbi:MAG TPA: glycosyltransferase [Candidatus Dormibacteraeota bacterium]|nr:glycosyltransferase [Candidatus Dormibacteraeota bacterium]